MTIYAAVWGKGRAKLQYLCISSLLLQFGSIEMLHAQLPRLQHFKDATFKWRWELEVEMELEMQFQQWSFKLVGLQIGK